jgi:SAM-dependent methyltransferase
MPSINPHDREWWEAYFAVGGGWEANGGREQTRSFAEAFTRVVEIERSRRLTILDVGCALGKAVKHFSTVFPNASLHGVDFSLTAIERCRAELGHLATFEVCDLDGIRGQYDLIYVSNVLEHFADCDVRARRLAHHCGRLCILVPYNELKDGRALSPDPCEHHQATFGDSSFDLLVTEGLACSVAIYIFSSEVPHAWDFRYAAEGGVGNPVPTIVADKGRPESGLIFYDVQVRHVDHPPV